MEAHFFDPKQDSLLSIKIIEKMSNKDWALKENLFTQKKIDSITIVLTELKKERLELKKMIPENYNYKEKPIDSLYKPFYKIKELEKEIPILTTELVHYPDNFLTGISDNYDKINWDDEKPQKFLVEVISLPNDGLDNNPEAHYFIGKFKPGKEFWISTNNHGGAMISQNLGTTLIKKNDQDNIESTAITKKKDAYKEFYSHYD